LSNSFFFKILVKVRAAVEVGLGSQVEALEKENWERERERFWRSSRGEGERAALAQR
jgi:hypothetical protein